MVSETLELKSGRDDGAKKVPTEFNVALHAKSYHVKVTAAGQKNRILWHFYFTVDGIPDDNVDRDSSEW